MSPGVPRSVTRDRFAAFGGTRRSRVPPGDCKTSGRRCESRGRRKRRYAHGRDHAAPPAPESRGPPVALAQRLLGRAGRTPWPAGPGENLPNLPSPASAQLKSTQRYETAGRRNAEPVPNAEYSRLQQPSVDSVTARRSSCSAPDEG